MDLTLRDWGSDFGQGLGLRLVNYAIPIGLLIAAVYALNKDYNIDVLQHLALFFPKEAGIFQRMAGKDVDFGVKTK